MRRLVSFVLTGALTVAAVALPVVTLPAAAARPVSPDLATIELDGVDAAAAADPTAIDAPVDEEIPAPGRGALERAGVTVAPKDVLDIETIEPLGSAADDDLAALSALERTDPFLVAGVTWDAGTSEVVTEVVVRVHEDGAWGDWQSLEATDVGVPGERGGTEPIVTSGADGIQARVRTESGQAPSGLRIELVDPGTSRADAHAAASAEPAATAAAADGYEIAPHVVTRAAWGADESLASAWPDVSADLKAIYVHHTAGTNSYTEAKAPEILRGIYAYHTQGMKWPDIGYQFLVDKYGNVYQGRRDAIDSLPIGAQAGGYNTTTIGVSALGNYETAKVTTPLVSAITNVIAWKSYQHGLDPTGKTQLLTGTSSKSALRFAIGSTVTVPVVLGHRDTNKTACPGVNLYAQLPSIRTAAKALVDQARATHGAPAPALAAPVVDPYLAEQSPVQVATSSTYTWQPVPGAARYELLTRTAAHGSAWTDTRAWKVLSTTTARSAKVSVAAGQSRLVAIRAIGADGRRGALTVLTDTVGPVSAGALTWSGSWTVASGTGAPLGVRRTSSSTSAKVSVTNVKDAASIVVLGTAGPGRGTAQVRRGATVLGTVDWSSPTEDLRAQRTVTLTTPVSGTIDVVPTGTGPVSISTLAFPRAAAELPTNVTTAAPVPVLAAPTLVAATAKQAPARLSTKVTVRWNAPAAPVYSYRVEVRTASHGKAYGAWKQVAETQWRKHALTIASGQTVQLAVRAVGPDGTVTGRSAVRTITRPVASGKLTRSKGATRWTRVKHGSYFRDFAYQTKARNATIKVTKVKDAKTVQIVAARGKGDGRFAVYAGSTKVATVSLAASRTTYLHRVNVKLPKAFSGTVTLKTLDKKRVRISAVTVAR